MRSKVLVATLIVGLMLATAFSGCLGGKKEEKPGPPEQKAEKGWIFGKVAAIDGGGISGAKISVGLVYIATTNETGEYKIINVEPGTYNVTATAQGYKEKNASVEIKAGEGTELNFELELEVPAGGPGLKLYLYKDFNIASWVLGEDGELSPQAPTGTTDNSAPFTAHGPVAGLLVFYGEITVKKDFELKKAKMPFELYASGVASGVWFSVILGKNGARQDGNEGDSDTHDMTNSEAKFVGTVQANIEYAAGDTFGLLIYAFANACVPGATNMLYGSVQHPAFIEFPATIPLDVF